MVAFFFTAQTTLQIDLSIFVERSERVKKNATIINCRVQRIDTGRSLCVRNCLFFIIIIIIIAIVIAVQI